MALRRRGGGTFANETILSGRPIEKSEREGGRETERECPKKKKEEEKGGPGQGISLVPLTDVEAKQQKL